jgi:hypothetical protein
MSVARKTHQRILSELLARPGKLYTRGVQPPYGLLVKAMAGTISYRFLPRADFFEAVPDYPSDLIGPEWLPIAVEDDAATSLFVRPWKDVEASIADELETEPR